MTEEQPITQPINRKIRNKNDTRNKGRALIGYIVLILHLIIFSIIFSVEEFRLLDYLATWLLGVTFASIELASKYKDDPASVLCSAPGRLYLGINGLICVFSLYLIFTFGLGYEVDDSLPLMSQRTLDVLQSSLAAFFIMRSSFLKLGHDSNIDLGLNAILKKLLEIVDREVDRVRAVKRSNEITTLFASVDCSSTKHIFQLCLNIMQNVSTEEASDIQRAVEELDSHIGSKDSDATAMDLKLKQLEIGLALYNIVGISVLRSAVKDLESMSDSSQPKTDSKTKRDVEDPQYITKLNVIFKDLAKEAKRKSGNDKKEDDESSL
ncbi:hypothetical protein [Vibrio parahaemolyticus]|uniref:hypothetical protein n=1 Tax=Vibrio parahaemolyticus TaxID=670 RepID=UPI001124A6CD|nr:hypothetical protein [Vibrio parahaemolyticus]MDF5077845.1 hypothetical protein [Vibrio parahaemolyticus]MDF5414353.1 hypothetical protein [Vibrio parahaemolyticus]MDF5424666.1 hypothetical protein [Vibrio parahaemolyticus]TOB64657.1 hypothetical protein CGK01_18340 [Vibrio parahaemolyticus]HBC3864109.1 hypothetical protein [Vibrio parahaemolyticus]